MAFTVSQKFDAIERSGGGYVNTYTVADLSNYVSEGLNVNDYVGIIKVLFDSVEIYNNTNYDSPDITVGLGTKTFPLVTDADGYAKEGTYEVTLSIRNKNTLTVTTNITTYVYNYQAPTIVIEHSGDGYNSTFRSFDATDYGTLTISRIHQLEVPSESGLVDQSTTGDTISLPANIWSGDYTTAVNTNVTYTNGSLTVADRLSGNLTTRVYLLTRDSVFAAMETFNDTYNEAIGNNPVLAKQYQALSTRLNGYQREYQNGVEENDGAKCYNALTQMAELLSPDFISTLFVTTEEITPFDFRPETEPEVLAFIQSLTASATEINRLHGLIPQNKGVVVSTASGLQVSTEFSYDPATKKVNIPEGGSFNVNNTPIGGIELSDIPDASTSVKGLVQLSNDYTGNSQSLAATQRAVKEGLATKVTYIASGAIEEPTFTDNGDGTATIGGCDVRLYTTIDYSGQCGQYTVAGITLNFIDGNEEYVCAKYNSGSPVIYKETSKANINNSSTILLFVCWRQGTVIHSVGNDAYALGLPEKIASRCRNTEPYKLTVDDGLQISETATPNPRTVIVTSAIVYAGINAVNVLSYNSSTDLLTRAVNTSGTWSYNSSSHVYDNTNYNPAGGLTPIPSNKYAWRYFYRSIGDIKECFYTLGTSYYNNIGAALNEAVPAVNTLLNNHCILVGKILIKAGATSGSVVISLIDVEESFYIPLHNELDGLQGGEDDERNHLSNAELAVAQDAVTGRGDGVANYPAIWVNTNQVDDYASLYFGENYVSHLIANKWYFATSHTADTINDIRIYNSSGSFKIERCTVGNATKGSGTWVEVQSGKNQQNVTSSGSISDNGLDVIEMVFCNSSTAITVNLPTAVSRALKEIRIVNKGTGTVTVDGFGTQTIIGELTQTLYQYDSLPLISDGSNWYVAM